MAVIDFSDDLSVGIRKIDEQHAKLIELMGELDDAIRSKQASELVEDILTSLFHYAQVHFATEEELFKRYEYPELELHELEHHKFIARVHALQEKYDMNRPGLSLELLDFISNWVLNHIKLTDKRYSTHLNSCGVL
jgi:hemerythrin